MHLALPCKGLSEFSPVAWYESAFSRAECERISAVFDRDGLHSGAVGGNVIEPTVRDSQVRFHQLTEDTGWVLQRIAKLAMQCNDARWRLQLSGFYEGVQLTQYDPGGHYDWHIDCGNNEMSIRKLSAIVQLADSHDYEGGGVEFIDDRKRVVPRAIGTLILFPSYLGHRVIPVTSGRRRSLVAWISGDSYR